MCVSLRPVSQAVSYNFIITGKLMVRGDTHRPPGWGNYVNLASCFGIFITLRVMHAHAEFDVSFLAEGVVTNTAWKCTVERWQIPAARCSRWRRTISKENTLKRDFRDSAKSRNSPVEKLNPPFPSIAVHLASL